MPRWVADGLPESERHALSRWLNEVACDDWDKQMTADFSPGGRGMPLVESVKRQIAKAKPRHSNAGGSMLKRNRAICFGDLSS